MSPSGGILSKVAQARRIAQPPAAYTSFTDIPYRAVSIYPTMLLSALGVSANSVTIFWGLLGLLGCALLTSASPALVLAGAITLEVAYLFDFVDGEVARMSGRGSKVGCFYDLIAHAAVKATLFPCLGLGLARQGAGLEHVGWGLLGGMWLTTAYGVPYLASALGLKAAPAVKPGPVMKWLRLSRILFESPGLYGIVLLGSMLNASRIVLVGYALGGAVWFWSTARLYLRMDEPSTSIEVGEQ